MEKQKVASDQLTNGVNVKAQMRCVLAAEDADDGEPGGGIRPAHH